MNDSDKPIPKVPSRNEVVALCILGALAGPFVGAFVGFVLGGFFAEVVNMSDQEGNSGYFALAIGFCGSGFGFIAGIGYPSSMHSRWYHKKPRVGGAPDLCVGYHTVGPKREAHRRCGPY